MNGSIVAQRAPDFFGDVRGHRREHQDEGLDGEAAHLLGLELRQVVQLIHHRCERSIEAQALDVIGHQLNRFVRALQRFFGGIAGWASGVDVAPQHHPHARDESESAGDAAFVPVGRFVEGAHEELPEPQRVGAVLVDHRVGRDDVALALRHPLAVRGPHDALVAERGERFVESDQLLVEHHLGPHPRVQQMHHGVLGAADVEVDRQPVIDGAAIERAAVFVRRGEAQEVP